MLMMSIKLMPMVGKVLSSVPNNAIEEHLENGLTDPCCRDTESGELTTDIREVKATERIVDSDGYDRGVFYDKSTFLDALLEDAAEDGKLADIETTTCMLKLDNVAEKLCLERAISDYGILDLIQTAKNISLQFLVGRQVERWNLFDDVDDLVHLTVHHCHEDLWL